MTVGQRIAQKRKELALSQEALGEQLGVSRQAIYKWESDATLPEIDKLIALSRTFRVSVGWLLGEEESAPEGELTEQQLRMVQEIVDRYLSAQPAPEQSKPTDPRSWLIRHKTPLLAAAGALAVVLTLTTLFDRLDTLDRRYRNLQGSLTNINSNVNNQIYSIANRVEQILESQNQLVSERSATIQSTDLAANTITFSVRVVPKTYRDGMSALFVARSNGELTEVPVPVGPGSAFEGEITCPLSDQIEVSVVFLSGDQRQTQFIDDWSGLWSGSFPVVYPQSGPLWFDAYDQTNTLRPDTVRLNVDQNTAQNINGESITLTDIRVGLFRDRELMFWYREDPAPIIVNGVQQEETGYFRDEPVFLDRNCVYSEVVFITDEYGRQRASHQSNIAFAHGSWESLTDYDHSEDPSFWGID